MNRPKKKIELRSEKWEILYKVKGYNDAICDYEAWLKEVASVDKIQKIMYKTEDDYELGETNSLHIAIAKAISKSILGE